MFYAPKWGRSPILLAPTTNVTNRRGNSQPRGIINTNVIRRQSNPQLRGIPIWISANSFYGTLFEGLAELPANSRLQPC